ncbi:unnamed protein product [Mytilus edulis]|uniref:Uncharacterized protein n=1 Tax=Mytilus edulis TaxID=6550 RepID=A0A8S3T482_MYTED|nr:unnamed protein product [Mytilus edulis]
MSTDQLLTKRRTHVNHYSFLDQTETKAEHQSSYKSSYSKYNSVKPDVQCENTFSMNSKSSVSDKETTFSSMNRSTAKEVPTIRRKYTSESTSDKKSADVNGPVVNERRTHVNPYSFLDQTETKAEPQISYKSSHSKYNSVKPDFQYENAFFLMNSKSSVSDKETTCSSMNRPTGKEEPTIRRKYMSESTSDKKSSDFNGPVINESRTHVNPYSFLDKTETKAELQSSYKSSHSKYNSVKPDVQCEYTFSMNSESSVSDKGNYVFKYEQINSYRRANNKT